MQNNLYTYLEQRFGTLDTLGSNEKNKTFLAKDEVSGQIVVKKIIARDNYDIYVQLKELDSPNLAHILYTALGEEDALVIIEYISGETLQTMLENNQLCSHQQAVSYLLDLLTVLSQIHKMGIIHRDISPKNILISTDGVPKLLDFDIGRFYKQASSQDTEILGTAGYAAPEQFGFIQSDRRTDIYAVGVLLNVCLTGKLPSEQQYAKRPLSQIIEKCTRFEPDKRYQSAEEILEELHQLMRKSGSSDFVRPFDESIWIGFRTGKLWKKLLAGIYYVVMGIYSIVSIVECSKTLPALLLEILAITSYVWLSLFLPLNFLHWMDKLPFIRRLKRPGRIILGIFLWLFFFCIGYQLELYVRADLLHIMVRSS